jgi:G3E family GTPase
MEEDHSTDSLKIGESLRFVGLGSLISPRLYSCPDHSQIAGSDVILLNKVDLVPLHALEEMEQSIRKVNPLAPIHRTMRGEIDLQHIIGISAYASGPQTRCPALAIASIARDREDYHRDDQGCTGDTDGHKHTKATHYELRGISSLQVTFPVLSKAQLVRFDEWIRTVLWENRLPTDSEEPEIQVLRCKGVFALDTGEQYILQGVRSMYELEKSEVAVQEVLGVPDAGKVVLIGKNLTDVVRRRLEDVLIDNTW